VLIVLLGFFYYKTVASYFSLVSIGLIAFVAVSQFAPIILGGIFWKGATKTGALVGLISGFTIWLFSLILPSLLTDTSGQYINIFIAGFFDFFAHFKIQGFDDISNTAFWSIVINSLLYFVISMYTELTPSEAKQALLFVDVFKYSTKEGQSVLWKGKARNEHLIELLVSFIGSMQAKEELEDFARKNNIDLKDVTADPKLVSYVENTISSIIGTSTARMLVASITKEEVVSIDEILEVLKRSQKIVEDNQELKIKTQQLEKLSKELRNTNEKLQKSDTIKNEFLTTVTHEIRTPLTSIKALTEIIYDNEDLGFDQKKIFLNTIIDETDRLSRLVNQVLDLEKYESGKHKLLKKNIDIPNLIDTVFLRMEELAKERNVKLKSFIHKEIKDFKADEDKLIQLLINLLSNAIKFSRPEKGWVLLTVDTSKNNVIFTVEDNGVGIPQEMQSRIFEKFYQADNQDSIKEKGSGLGLSISKKIVEIHKGNVKLESMPDKGTKVMVGFPY
jgi:signal transduction histidine kinase